MIQLTDNQISIMGKPNFACANMAKMLIASGLYEDKEKRAEYEQAVFIHWALQLLEEYGEDWKNEGGKILTDCASNILEAGD